MSRCKQKFNESWALKEAKTVERCWIQKLSQRKYGLLVLQMRRSRVFLVENPCLAADIFFLSRLAAKVSRQPVKDQDMLAVDEQVNFCLARESVL